MMTFTPPPPNLFAVQDTQGTHGNSELGIYVAALVLGLTDCTSSLQNQIDAVSESGGGTLIIPRGFYTIATSIIIRNGVRLKGVIDATQSWDNTAILPQSWKSIPGTLIRATGFENDPDGDPLFKLESGSSISSLSVYYPNQIRDRDLITPYPWTIFVAGPDGTVENITLYNSYLGIKVGKIQSDSHSADTIVFSGERHRIRNVFGTVINTGLWVDFCPDIGRIENVHFHAEFWGYMDGADEQGQHNYLEVQKIMTDNLTAFKFGLADWEYVSNTFVWPAQIAYHFVQSERHPNVTRREMNGEFIGVAFDKCCTGFKVDYLQSMGIIVTNGQFDANGGDELSSPRTAIEITDTCEGNVRFTNCNFWGDAKMGVVSNSNSFLSLSNCYFRNTWGDYLEPVITVNSGRVQLIGCSFETTSTRDHIRLNAGTAKAIVTCNTAKNTDIGGGFRVDSHIMIPGSAIIANNET